jgi:EF hand domain-containing protein
LARQALIDAPAAPSLPETETSMNRKILYATVVLALASAGTAIAQQSSNAPAQPQPEKHLRLDANNDGVVDRAEAAASPGFAARFDQMDKNKDGRLTADERPERHGGHRGGRDGHGKMMQADKDKDGRISKAEATADPKLAERFVQMDANKDGFVDRADFQARMAQHRDECFGKADTDSDGKLSRDEYAKTRETCRPQMHRGDKADATPAG